MKIIFTLIILVFFTSTETKAEGVISFGGNTILMDFYMTLDKIIQDQKNVPLPIRIYPDLPRELEGLTDKLQIKISSLPLYWNNTEVIMINYPELHTIELSLERWKELKDESVKKMIVFHEVLPLLGLTDTNYQWTRKMSKIAANYYSSDALFIYLTSSDEAPSLFAEQSFDFYKTAPIEMEFVSIYLQQDNEWIEKNTDSLIRIAEAYFNSLNRNPCYDISFKNDLIRLSTKKERASQNISKMAAKWQSLYCK